MPQLAGVDALALAFAKRADHVFRSRPLHHVLAEKLIEVGIAIERIRADDQARNLVLAQRHFGDLTGGPGRVGGGGGARGGFALPRGPRPHPPPLYKNAPPFFPRNTLSPLRTTSTPPPHPE